LPSLHREAKSILASRDQRLTIRRLTFVLRASDDEEHLDLVAYASYLEHSLAVSTFTTGWPESSGSPCRERGVSLTSMQALLDSNVEFSFHHMLARFSYIGKCCMRDAGDTMLRVTASNIPRALSHGYSLLRRKIHPWPVCADSLSQAKNVFRDVNTS
jgi:hypothetical protein